MGEKEDRILEGSERKKQKMDSWKKRNRIRKEVGKQEEGYVKEWNSGV